MLSIIISIIFFGMMAGMIFIKYYQYKFIKQLEKNSGIRITKSNQISAKRDLKEVVNSNVDNSLKVISKKIIELIKISNRLFFGSIILIIMIFILNAFFRWES